jgi:2-polyprenyl-6-methoxyphenol hydroxylase-like FAD-dependent oxidoreductase
VGDAGYWRHPITAQGITDCFRDVELLTQAIDDGFTDRRPLEDGLAAYESARNRATKAMYDSTNERTMMEPLKPEFVQLLKALEGNQEAIDRLLGVDAGTVRAEDFFSPANMSKIFEQAAHTARGSSNRAVSMASI